MSLDNNDSSQKVLNSDGLRYLLQKLNNTHIGKKATDTELGHVKIGPTATPSAINGEGVVAPSYHTHPAQTEITGNAGTASKLKSAVNIALTGNVTGNADFDGSKDITINTTINKNGQAITGKTSLSGLEPGDYIENSGGKYTDSPNGSNSTNDFTISVIGSGNDKTQIFTDLVTGKVYIRTIENGTPSTWKEVLTISGGNIDANTTSADKLKNARTISISGDAEGSTSFDGSKNVDIDLSLSDTGVDADTYGSNSQANFNSTREIVIPSYTVDSAGRITSSSDQTIKIPESSGSGTGGSGGINPVTIGLSGDVSGSKVFDGTTDITINTSLANSGVTAGTYGTTNSSTVGNDTVIKIPKLTLDAKGRVTSASNSDITFPSDAFDKVKTSSASSGVIYLSGKSTSDTDIGSELISPNLYYDVTNNTFHAGKIAATIEGVSGSADKLSTARDIVLTGDVSGTTSFDGSKNVSIATTLKDSGATAGTYGLGSAITLDSGASFAVPQLTVDSKGRITMAKHSTVTLPESALNKVKTSVANAGIIYLSGKSTTDDNTDTEILNPNLYYDVTNNTFHAGKIAATIEGVSGSADKLSVARSISLSGDVSGTTSFDGSKDVSINAVLANSGVTAGTYGNISDVSFGSDVSLKIPKIVISAKGLITAASMTTATISADSLNKVKASPVTTGKIYLSGKASSTENTSSDIMNSGLYYDVDTKTLVAPNVSGKASNATSADKLSTAASISLAGDASGSTSFDGSKNVTITTTLANSGVTAGTYGDNSKTLDRQVVIPKYTVDAKGRITSVTDQTVSLPTSADTAAKLSKARTIALSGDVTGTTSFDGSEDASISTSLANSGVTAGKYGAALSTTLGTDSSINIPYITVDAKGRITAAKNSPLTIPDNAFNTVKTDIADSGYIFISGKNELVAGNGTEVINSDLYYDVTNKILHAGKIAGTIEGVSDSANRLAKAVNINLVGAVTGSQAFDGSTSINITTTIDTVTNEEIDLMMEG